MALRNLPQKGILEQIISKKTHIRESVDILHVYAVSGKEHLYVAAPGTSLLRVFGEVSSLMQSIGQLATHLELIQLIELLQNTRNYVSIEGPKEPDTWYLRPPYETLDNHRKTHNCKERLHMPESK